MQQKQKVFYKRNLPHYHPPSGNFFVTYRLKGSIPLNMISALKEEFAKLKTSKEPDLHQKRIFKYYDDILDKCENGIKHLSNPDVAEVVKTSLHFPDNKSYNLICFCVMPNHVHLLFKLIEKQKSVRDILTYMKQYSARESNKILGLNGAFWQPESFDRLVRDEKEFRNVVNYILMNPVKAGLVENWKDWPHTYLNEDYL